MTDPVPRRTDVEIGEISGGQVVIGDHTTVQTTAGTRVTVVQTGDRPVPRLRSLPVSVRPAAAEIFGREEEIAAAARVATGAPLQIYAPEGAGKTALLKAAAERVEAPPEGVVFLAARRRSLDEIQLRLYEAFWQCDVPFLPSLEQVGGFLAEREALLVLDDCGLDRNDLGQLLDTVPRSNLVLASAERTLWSCGSALPLGGLDAGGAIELLERELGRGIEPAERDAAGAIAERLEGRPQALVEVAALVGSSAVSLPEIAADPQLLARSTDPSSLTVEQLRLLELLEPLDGAPLAGRELAELSGIADATEQLRELERLGWAKAASPRYRLVRPLFPRSHVDQDAGAGERLLKHLTAWSDTASPAELAVEADAVRATVRLGAATGRWAGSVDLARAAEWKLTVAGAWTAAWQTMRSGLAAARELGDESAEAHFLHQHGSLALCNGDREQAASQLAQALALRERLGESAAAELTRHNLEQLGGGPPGGKGNGAGPDGGGPWRPPIWATLGIVAGVIGLVLAMTLFAGGSPDGSIGTGTETRDPGGSITDPGVTGSGDLPLITITQPTETTYDEGFQLNAEFTCSPVAGGGSVECTGTLDGKTTVLSGDVLSTEPGTHRLEVHAIDSAGRGTSAKVDYTVEAIHSTDEDEDEPPDTSEEVQ